jgi:hypothetical protein
MAKKIVITSEKSMIDWVDDNRDTVYGILYDNIFDFLESEEDKRIILEVIIKQSIHIDDSNYDGISMDFVITKEHMNETIDKLVKHFETNEEYEKCSKLVKLKK